MSETKECPKCGGISYHNKGVSKTTGKPYENWKCSSCKDVEWVNSKVAQPNYPKPDTKIIDRLADMDLKLDFIISKINERDARKEKTK